MFFSSVPSISKFVSSIISLVSSTMVESGSLTVSVFVSTKRVSTSFSVVFSENPNFVSLNVSTTFVGVSCVVTLAVSTLSNADVLVTDLDFFPLCGGGILSAVLVLVSELDPFSIASPLLPLLIIL
uniref:Uncharacterized protein n=1 Tax=Cacopsylla melanoneura TaxID=428564 RepID=A0A8D9DQE2_9HEMI